MSCGKEHETPCGEVLDRVFSGKRWDGEIHVVGPAGRHHALVSVSPLRTEGSIDGALLLGEDAGTSRGRARRLARRTARRGATRRAARSVQWSAGRSAPPAAR